MDAEHLQRNQWVYFLTMKIIRSSKCSIKYSTKFKKNQLKIILNEYKNVVNYFIDLFYEKPILKAELLKDIVNSAPSWFSHRMKKTAAREALDMLKSSYSLCEKNREDLMEKSNLSKTEKAKNKYFNQVKNLKPKKPKHYGKRMCVSCDIAELQAEKTSISFDAWLHLSSIGKNILLDMPINFHNHYKKWHMQGKRLNYYILTTDYIQFCFEIDTGPKKDKGLTVGCDTGVKSLSALSTGDKFGGDIEYIIHNINRCKQGSKRQKKLRNSLKQRMDEVAKQLTTIHEIDCIVVEKLNNLNKNSKNKRSKSKYLRKVISTWVHKYWLTRLQMDCENNRVVFRSVSAYNTSIMCASCGHVDKRNRTSQEIFMCLRCGHTDEADVNAAINIRDRFLTGKYGSGFKPLKRIRSFIKDFRKSKGTV